MARGAFGPIALDAMGGDHAPAATVQGAVEAVRQHGLNVLLVGREAVLRRELAKHGSSARGMQIVDAPDVVAMDDPAIAPARHKRDSSMAVAARLVRDGKASAFVTAGNSGAAMVAAKAGRALPDGTVLLAEVWSARLDTDKKPLTGAQEALGVVLGEDGPVDAAYRAIERITGTMGKLTEYSLKSVSLGHDTVGEAFIRVEIDGVLYNGRAASTDIVTGSVVAYLGALNRALASHQSRLRRRQPVTGEV